MKKIDAWKQEKRKMYLYQMKVLTNTLELLGSIYKLTSSNISLKQGQSCTHLLERLLLIAHVRHDPEPIRLCVWTKFEYIVFFATYCRLNLFPIDFKY